MRGIVQPDFDNINAEMKDWKQGKDAGVSDWRMLKDKYYNRVAKDPEGLPTYDSIDWKAKNADGVTLDKTAFHALEPTEMPHPNVRGSNQIQ